MLYHKVPAKKMRHCVNYSHKRNDEHFCVICDAKINVQCIGTLWLTISPSTMSGNRLGQTLQPIDGGRHFVLWSNIHDRHIDINMVNEVCRFLKVDSFGVYTHGLDQYGHPHVHIIVGNYHDIRAREMMNRAQKCINNGTEFDTSDIYNPIIEFFNKCETTEGRNCIVTMIMITKLRIKLSPLADIFRFYKSSYYDCFVNIREYFRNNFDDQKFHDIPIKMNSLPILTKNEKHIVSSDFSSFDAYYHMPLTPGEIDEIPDLELAPVHRRQYHVAYGTPLTQESIERMRYLMAQINNENIGEAFDPDLNDNETN